MSSTPKIICRVKAIYPFYSNEPSSLNFEKDDYIDVLAQLDSGWWDGWCGGSRGWFPSNYVQVVEDNVADTESLIDYDKEEPVAPSEPIAPPRQERPTVKTRRRRSSSGKRRRARPHSLSYPTQTVNLGWTGRISTVYSSDDDESIARAEMLPEGWSMQVAEDGRTYYYYNHRTGKMQYEHPGTLSDDDSDDGYIYRRQSVDSFGEVQYNKPSAGNRLSLDSLPADVETPDPTISDSSPNIMSQWVERKTPQGRTYYCNLVTQETTWNLDDVDLKTGRLKNVRDSLSDSEEEAAVNHIRQQSLRDMPERADPHYDEEEAAAAANVEKPSTWQKLSSDTALAIHQLSIAAQRGDQQSINDNAWSVVDTIRVMLYASGSLDKDASHMQDRALRDPQRAVMASLSKLVLSVKSASESPKPETLYRVQRDANDVLAAVRAFVTACQDKRVGIIQVRPQLLVDTCHASAAPENDATPEGGATNNNEDANEENNEKTNRRASQELPAVQKAKYSLNQDLVISLQTHANQIFGSTDALSKATAYVLKIYTEPVNDDEMQDGRRDSVKARSNVVILFRNLSMQLGQYLSILEDVDMGNVDGSKIPSLPDFRVSKQGMYNAVGYLFHAVQTLSNEDGDLATATNALEDAIRQCETVVENVLRNVEDMVEQRKIWYMKTSLPDRDAAMSPTAAAADDVEDGGLDFPVIRSGLEKPRKSQYTIRPPEARSADWCLGYDYAPDELVFSSDGNVKGGTLRALVERLTLHDALDTSFIATFLLTYRSFCTTEELFSLLEQRYELQPSEGLTPFELETWTERKQKLVRLRVFNVMKSWLENYYNDEDEFILSRLEFFTNTVIRDASPFSADQLNRLIRKRKELNANKGLKKLVPNAMAGPLPIIPKDMTRVTLLDIDPLELSRQLSLLDFKLYSNIRPSECLNKAWSREDAGGNIAIHVKQSIDYCNRLTCWVSDSILANEEAKKRVVVIKYWAQVAARCRQLNNYNTCMAIISAFDNSAVGRLRKTWELVGNRTTQTLGHIRKLMGANRNFQEYREMIHSVNPPCIPFLGIYLQDLTFIEDGNPDFINKPLGLINFAKRQKAAEVIREINQFQSPPYTFQAVSELQAFIKSHLESSRDIDKLYERSLQLEPREPAS